LKGVLMIKVVYAGFWIRVLALIIDWVMISFLLSIINLFSVIVTIVDPNYFFSFHKFVKSFFVICVFILPDITSESKRDGWLQALKKSPRHCERAKRVWQSSLKTIDFYLLAAVVALPRNDKIPL